MVRTAPTPEGPDTRRLRPEAVGAVLRETADAAAARLSAAGATVELHPIVANERGAPVVVTYGALLASFTFLALAWPIRASILLAMLLVSGLLDLEGRHSWVRRLAPREGGRAILQWASPSDKSGPVVLVVVPDEAHRIRGPGAAASLVGGISMVGLVGALGRPFLADLAGPLLVSVGVAATVLACIALIQGRRGRPQPDAESGVRLAERVIAALQAEPAVCGRVAVATVGGGFLFHDGIAVLLANQRPRLGPSTTRIVTWQPADGALRLVERDGRMLRSAADRGLVEALAPLELPTTTGVTAAARARSGGWRSVGLQGGLDDPARIVKTLAEAARLAAGAE